MNAEETAEQTLADENLTKVLSEAKNEWVYGYSLFIIGISFLSYMRTSFWALFN